MPEKYPATVDRFIRTMLKWRAAEPPSPVRTLTVAQARRRYSDGVSAWCHGVAPEPVADVADTQVKAGDGKFGARIYLPVRDRSRLVTYLHGGGWTVGDVDTHDRVCRRISSALGAVVMSADYRRAPEHPYPVPLLDGVAAAEWAAETFPCRDHVIAGDSAGAGLATGVSLHNRDRGDLAIAAQLLVCPTADPSMTTESIRTYGSGYLLDLDDLQWYYDQYVPDPGTRRDPAIDLVNADLGGLPPTVLGTAEFDPLHDEGVELVARLETCGVPVRHVPAPGLVHGYLLMADRVPAALTAAQEVFAAVEEVLSRPR